jgi:cell wall-associated NlpC family hydrolase
MPSLNGEGIKMITVSKILIVAMQYLGTPYIWGGQKATVGFDCSGFVQTVLQDCELYTKETDRTAQALYYHLSDNGKLSELKHGAVLFFGRDTDSITHTAIAINPDTMIEAGGGDRETTIENYRDYKDARVRIKPINSRRDLCAAINL